ncbi:MAG TPA: toll/interleukin-1 receptor domain-containing protein [Bryobacteraceae bacterium]
MSGEIVQQRRAIFISHATPEDNIFTTWLGAKLAAAGYEVWADVLCLYGGDDWQRKLEDALRNRACKVLLVANPSSVNKQGVRNEIQIASDIGRRIGDSNFILPLRLARFDAPFLIAQTQYIDFSRGWAAGFHELLQLLREEYKVPTQPGTSAEAWCSIQGMHGRDLLNRPEHLISNWLRIRKLPEKIFYYRKSELNHHGITLTLPNIEYLEGFLTCEEHRIENASQIVLEAALESGWAELGISTQDMRNRFTHLANQGMELLLKSRGLNAYELASGKTVWWFGNEFPDSRQSFTWSNIKGSRVLKGHSLKRKLHWHFGISSFYRGNFPRHYRIKTHLLFSDESGALLASKRMHRVRRSFAKSWRNARWRDMLLASLYWLSGGESLLRVPLHLDDDLLVEVPPIFYTSPVSIQEGDAVEVDLDDPDIEFVDDEVLEDEEE